MSLYNMDRIKLLAIMATILGFLAFIPEIKTLTKQKDFSSYSYGTTLLTTISLVLWGFHDILTKSWITFVGVLLGALVNLYILCNLSPKSKNKEPEVSPLRIDVLSEYTL